jgi:hypothetical protein
MPDLDPTGRTEGAIKIGNLNDRKKGYRNTDEIGLTEGGARDLQDFYEFTLGQESEVDVTLDQLKANANVEIVDADGSTVLFQSMEANRTRENITENLEAGTYYVRVYPEGDERTKYRLGVSADALTDEKDAPGTAKGLGNIGLKEVRELDDIGFGRGKNRDEQDYYKFSIKENSEFFLTLDQLKANANVEVLDSDGSTLLYQSVNSGRKAEKIQKDLNAGDYYVRVVPQGSAKTDYRLGLSADPIDDGPLVDLGEVTETTPVLKRDNLGRGRNKVDRYSFTLPEESDVNLTLDGLRADLNVEIYDAGGELVEESQNPGSKAEKIELEGQEAGTYTVKVSPKGAAKTNYRLGITAIASEGDDYSTPEEALDWGAIAIGDKKVLNNEMGFTVGRSGRDQEDWIRFNLDKESLVELNLGRLSQNIDMTLYDGDGQTIISKANREDRANDNISVILDEGTYYAQVFPKGNARSEYRLTATVGPIGGLQEFEVGDLQSLEGSSYSQLGERIGFTSSGVRNTIDRYFFTVSGKDDSDVEIDLTGLGGDANITLYESDGSFLFDSRESGRSNENISETLEPGKYYVDVEPQNAAKTKYNLDIFAGGWTDPDGGPVPDTNLYNNIGGGLARNYSKTDTVGFGNGSRRDEVDYYRFTLSEEKDLRITLTKLSDNINLELLDGSGSVISDSRKTGKSNESIQESLDPGTYYVGVKPQGSARGSYTLNIANLVVDDPDGGKPPENVNDIGVLTTYEDKDSIGSQGSGYRDANDYRKFTLTEQSKLNINLNELTANADLELYDSDGRTLLSRSANGGSSDETINTTLGAGDYYVRVLPKGAASTAYNLNMNAVDGNQDDDDPPGKALGTVGDPLTEGGLVGFGDINDYYNFDVGFPAFVSVKLDGLSGNADLQLYDSTGEVLLGSSTNSGSTGEEVQAFLDNDNYVVRVFGQGSQTPYDMSVSLL